MKKTMRIIGLACAAVALLPLASCGGDDEGGITPPGEDEIIKETGMRLSSVGDYEFTYDQDGRCILVEEESYDGYGYDNRLEIDWKKGTITCKDGDDYEIDEVYHFKTNGKGYITEITQSQRYQYDFAVKVEGKATFSYDKSGHLTKMTLKATETGIDEGYKFKDETKVEYNLKWVNGNLVSAEAKEEESDVDGREYDEYNYDLTYSDDLNEYRQITMATFDYLYDFSMSILGHVGMFGVGTKNLPMHMTETSVDEDGEDTENYSVSYSTNNLGLITRENISGSTFTYSYEGVDDLDNYSMKSNAPQKKQLKHKSLFFHHRKAAK